MSEVVRAIIALGGNLGDRKATITSAIKAIRDVQGIKVLDKSGMVESFAFTEQGLDETAPRYLNAVIAIETKLKPKKLLEEMRAIETAHGRVRLSKWGSRTLDIDIITYGSLIKETKLLTLPHPRAHERAFVLVPWAQIDQDAVLPGHGKIATLGDSLKHQVWELE